MTYFDVGTQWQDYSWKREEAARMGGWLQPSLLPDWKMAFDGQKRKDQEEEDMEILINIWIVMSNTSVDTLRAQTLEADSPEQSNESKPHIF